MAGKRSRLVEDEDEDEGEAHPHVSQSLLYQLLNASVFSSTPQLFVHFPMERFFTRRAGPPGTAGAGAQRHVEEEDFLALVRHNAAAQLEMERWPPALKKRRVGKPTMDEQYTQALCNWVATLEAPRPQMDLPPPPLRRLQVSRRVRRGQEDDGSQTGGHARGQAPIALDVLRDGVRCAPFLHHEHGRDGSEAPGPWAAWLGETEAGRTGSLHWRR